MVTLSTIGFKNFYVLPTECIYVSVWISEQTEIISLHIIKLVGFYKRMSVFTARYDLNLQIQFRPNSIFKESDRKLLNKQL